LNEKAFFSKVQSVNRVEQSFLLLKIVHFREIKVQDSGVWIFDGFQEFLQSSWIVIENAERFEKCAQANGVLVHEQAGHDISYLALVLVELFPSNFLAFIGAKHGRAATFTWDQIHRVRFPAIAASVEFNYP
jgi:hypothetical protein